MNAIRFSDGCQDVVKTPSKSIGIFSYFPDFTFTIMIESCSPLLEAKDINLPSGDHEIPGCNHFNSSKSGIVLPLINLFFCFSEPTS
jgi:hypothetical protein